MHRPHRTKLTACNLRSPLTRISDLHRPSCASMACKRSQFWGLQKVSSAAGRRVSDGLEWLSFSTEQSVGGNASAGMSSLTRAYRTARPAGHRRSPVSGPAIRRRGSE